jgi:hypothetical protein
VKNVLDEHEKKIERYKAHPPLMLNTIVNWFNCSMLLSGARESLYNFWPIWFDGLSFLVLSWWRVKGFCIAIKL